LPISFFARFIICLNIGLSSLVKKGVAVAADVATIVTTRVVATTEDEGRYLSTKSVFAHISTHFPSITSNPTTFSCASAFLTSFSLNLWSFAGQSIFFSLTMLSSLFFFVFGISDVFIYGISGASVCVFCFGVIIFADGE
jgi:hypothetical protein